MPTTHRPVTHAEKNTSQSVPLPFYANVHVLYQTSSPSSFWDQRHSAPLPSHSGCVCCVSVRDLDLWAAAAAVIYFIIGILYPMKTNCLFKYISI